MTDPTDPTPEHVKLARESLRWNPNSFGPTCTVDVEHTIRAFAAAIRDHAAPAEAGAREWHAQYVAAGKRADLHLKERDAARVDAAALRRALEKALSVGLPPCDASGARMWQEAHNARMDTTAGADLLEELERKTAALQTIQQWDCLNPVDPEMCGDFSWLKKLVDDTLAKKEANSE